jgi:adenylate cyclase
MLDTVWPDLASDCAKGLLAGGASLVVQWLVPSVLAMVRRAQARRAARRAGRVPDAARRADVVRRIAAILAIDVVGYSRLMAADEEGTYVRLMRYRRDRIEPTIREHRGSIVKHTGDGALVAFGSVVDAVRCAVELQRAVDAPPAHRIAVRIGVNLGDVIIEPNDIYGDSVNVAVRLEGLAEPGGICVSEDAWRHVRGKVAAEFVDLGHRKLKNIADPVHVYSIPAALERVTSAETSPGERPEAGVS